MGGRDDKDIVREASALTLARTLAEKRGGRSLSAYYFDFDSTGDKDVDLILQMVAVAGRGWHSTEMWNDEVVGYFHDEFSYIELIQAAANAAARRAP